MTDPETTAVCISALESLIERMKNKEIVLLTWHTSRPAREVSTDAIIQYRSFEPVNEITLSFAFVKAEEKLPIEVLVERMEGDDQ